MAGAVVRFISHRKEALAKVEQATSRAYMKMARMIERDAKQSIVSHTAKVPGMSKKEVLAHSDLRVVSLPGNPPNSQTGNLKLSIASAPTTKGTAVVGPVAYYGRFLEYGTSRMEARPFMQPAANRNLPNLPKMVRDEVKGVR